MGTLEQQKNEWAAFLGHTTHESAQYTAAREALMCARTVEVASGTYCRPCANDNFDWEDRYCEISLVANGQYFEQYCDKIVTPPHGCVCGPTTEVDNEELKGLMNPNFAYFGRGAIQLSWNANYIKASQVLAESADTLCSQPDLVATEPKYAWGTAIWFWLFHKPTADASTCHIQSLEGSFGGSLNVINGGLECPADPMGYHAEAIVTRLRYYCIAATIVGVQRLLDFEGCEGLSSAFEECVTVRGNSGTVLSPYVPLLTLCCARSQSFSTHNSIHLNAKTGYCPECNDWYLISKTELEVEPTVVPAPEGPTSPPVPFRSWADDSWMNSIQRSDSSARTRKFALITMGSILLSSVLPSVVL